MFNILVIMLAGNAVAWNSGTNFSNVQDSNNWQYGYIDTNDTFHQLPDFGDHYYMDMSGWFVRDNWQTQCIANQNSVVHEVEFWGSWYVAKPHMFYLCQANTNGERACLRWKAPTACSYIIDANFSGAIYSGGQTKSNVSIIRNNSCVLFADYIDGFAGGNGRNSSGVRPSVLYHAKSLPLKTGDTLDFVQEDRDGSTGNDIISADISVAVANDVNFSVVLKPFDLKQVCLLDGPCKVAQEATREYLNYFDSDRLLYTMRATAGLPTPGQPLGGWEEPNGGIRGNLLGHYLSACALMYASTGDETLKAKADYIVSELKVCQRAIGTGYLFAAPPEAFTRLENAQPRIIGVPYYALHKLMAGLYDMYNLTGNKESLDILTCLTDYFVTRFNGLTNEQRNNVLKAEFGGMTEVMYNLYKTTGNADYIQLGDFFNQDPKTGIRWTSGYKPEHAKFYESLVTGVDSLDGTHANTYLAEVVGTARRYEILGDSRDFNVVRNLWDLVTNTRSYVTGGSGDAEAWHEANKLVGTFSNTNEETCATYNMLKLTRDFIIWTGDAKYADFYERLFLNGIMSTQNPSDGMTIYYLPMATNCKKNHGTPYDDCWCCTGTGMENFSKIGDSIYFHDANGVYVNLFIASTLNWAEKNIQIEQHTRFPNEDRTSFVFHTASPIALKLNIHVPYWAKQGVEVKVNGEPISVTAGPTSYAVINRQWGEGDKVDVHMPMSLHSSVLPDDPHKASIMYGPVVLANSSPDSNIPSYLVGDINNLSSWISPVDGQPLRFHVSGQDTAMTLIPLINIINERYGIYWNVVASGSPEHEKVLAAKRAVSETRTIDRVNPNDPNSESVHNMIDVNSSDGNSLQGGWRAALSSGWWSWNMEVLPNIAMNLICTYWGSDVAPRTFDILVDGTVIATQILDNNKPNKLFDVEYQIPSDLTRGKTSVTVKFIAHTGNTAGRVFGCATLTRNSSWNTARNYYTDTTPVRQNDWQYGYKAGLCGEVTPFTKFTFSADSFYMDFSMWSIQDWWQIQNIYNRYGYAKDVEYWGGYAVLKPYSTYLGVSVHGDGKIPVYRWIAPMSGDYQIFADFWGASYLWHSLPQGTSSAVHVVVNDKEIIFNDTIDGFVGGNTRPSFGNKPMVSYTSLIQTLHKGDTVDFIATDNNSLGADVTGVSGTVVLMHRFADLNEDGIVNFSDLATLFLQWLKQGESSDLNADNIINFEDFNVLAEGWLK